MPREISQPIARAPQPALHGTLAASPSFILALAILLAVAHGILAITATVEKSMTSDEIAHLTAGEAYNTRADYRLQPENGVLPQRWAALPLTLGHAPLPGTAEPSWQHADVWNYGYIFFYTQGFASGEYLFLGRAMVAVFSVATALLVFFWSRHLFGMRGGFVSLVLYTLAPEFLAHGALATSDVVMTFFFVACSAAWWKHLHSPGATWTAVSVGMLGLAFVAKVSAILLIPMFALSAAAWVWQLRRDSRAGLLVRRLVMSAVVHGVGVWGVLWLFYRFRYSAFAPALAGGAEFNHSWAWVLEGLGLPGYMIVHLRDWRLLPEAWLYGLSFVLSYAKARGAFLNGEYSLTGWVRFFPYTFLVKSTLPCLILLGAALARAAGSARQRLQRQHADTAAMGSRWWDFTPLLALFVVYTATSLTSHLNIGHRHILPIYPAVYIAIGSLGAWLDFRRPARLAFVLLLLAWQAGASFWIRPHYLAYFNELVGGPKNGWQHLVDSSLDWGQDLPTLKRWLDAHGRGETVYLSYFGTGDPVYEGIRARPLPSLPIVGPPQPRVRLGPGIYAVSATMLQQVYSPLRGDWTRTREKDYETLRAAEPLFLEADRHPKDPPPALAGASIEETRRIWTRYDTLRFARLCYYLRLKQPEATAGYSILIYRLDASEVQQATAGSLAEWTQLITRAATAGR